MYKILVRYETYFEIKFLLSMNDKVIFFEVFGFQSQKKNWPFGQSFESVW